MFNVGDHWICATNVFSPSSHVVYVYDSVYRHLHHLLVVHVSSISRAKDSSDSIDFVLQPFQQQRHGTWLCGFYAVAACVSCTLRQNPAGRIFTEELLFPHHTELVVFNHVQLFDSRLSDDCVNPKTVHAAKLHCMCQMPSSSSRQMVQCDQCQSWYHMPKCVPQPASPGTLATLPWRGPCCHWRRQSSTVLMICSFACHLTCGM